MKTEIWHIYSAKKPSLRRLSFKNDMTTLEKNSGWVAEKVSGDMMELPVVEAGFFSREAMKSHSDGNSSKKEPVAWPCVIETADFEEDTVTLKMQSKDYSVGVGLHWLSTTQPQRKLTDEINRLRKALVYVAHELHATPQYMLAKGITLLDGDAVRVSIDGCVVEASNKTIEAAHGIKVDA